MKDYKKLYEEALGRAGHLMEKLESNHIKWFIYSIFPELLDSEDDKIKKSLITLLKHFCNGYRVPGLNFPVSYKEMLAWLEKQDYTFEIKAGHWYKCVCDYMLNSSDLMFKNDRLYYCRSDWRLRGEIDERNVKNIGVHGYKSFFRPATNQEIKDWIEKQGEKKSIDKIEPKFKVGN